MLAHHKDITLLQRAFLDQNSRNGATAHVKLRLDHGPLGGTVRIGLEFEYLGLQRDRFEQFFQTLASNRRHFHILHIARHRLDDHLVTEQIGAHLVGIGGRQIDLVDRHDHRHLGRLGMVDGLDGLRHHGIIGCNDKHDNIRHLRPARAHRGKGRVARRVEEAEHGAAVGGDLIRPDMLGDTTSLASDDLGISDRVQKRGLAVVNVTHDGDHRRPRHEILGLVLDLRDDVLHIRVADTHDAVAEFLDDQFCGIRVDRLVLRDHHAILHEGLDHVTDALGHAVRQFRDNDHLGQLHVAHDLFTLLRTAHGLLTRALLLALHRRHGFLPPAFAARKRLVERQLAGAAGILTTTPLATTTALVVILTLARSRGRLGGCLSCRSGGHVRL
ncbi:hypothetical protein ROTO_33190 [Roseovarius tolerans]|uniref:NAD-specific glutamate dehydrogenase n=1 Tax=Roseovarius tolerans TaxID=74031 RepID=A0A0L6CQV2_9RHOB|nr:hypothetical protein ROTO_33190 [Roseovarius tolerans]